MRGYWWVSYVVIGPGGATGEGSLDMWMVPPSSPDEVMARGRELTEHLRETGALEVGRRAEIRSWSLMRQAGR